MLRTRHDFEGHRDTPEALLYVIYVIVKSFICIYYFCHRPYKKVTCQEINFVGVQRRNCSSCWENCGFHCLRWSVYNIWKYSTKLSHLIVGVVFGAPLGVVERSPSEYMRSHGHKDDQDQDNKEGQDEDDDENHPDDIPRYYIHGKRVKYRDATMLALMALPFIILLATTFWDRLLFKESTNCDHKNENVFCFPQAKPPYTNKDLGISVYDQKIYDCDKWNDSSRITFICFETVIDFGGALAAVGGLITVFKVTTRLGATIMISVAEFLLNCTRNGNPHGQRTYKENIKLCCRCVAQFYKTKTDETSDSCQDCSSCPNGCIDCRGIISACCCECRCTRCSSEPNWIKICRQLLAILLTILELGIAIGIIHSYAEHQLSTGSLAHTESLIYKVFDHLNTPLLIVAVVATSLFLPLEDYVQEEHSNKTGELRSYSQQARNIFIKFLKACYDHCSRCCSDCCDCCDCCDRLKQAYRNCCCNTKTDVIGECAV